MQKTDTETIANRFRSAARAGPESVLYAALVSVWSRWFDWMVTACLIAYRPDLRCHGRFEYMILYVPLLKQRIEMSQAIHDTKAQTLYMIGLRTHRVREPADRSNGELTAALKSTPLCPGRLCGS